MIVYIDSVFLLNAAMDALLLYFTGYVAGIERKIWRIFLAGSMGGLYAVSAFLPWGAFLSWAMGKVLCGAGLIWIAYGRRREFFRLFGVFLGLSFALAGATIACGFLTHTDLYYRGALLLPIKLPVLLCSTFFCFAFLLWFQGGSLHHQVRGEIVQGSCMLCGRQISMRVLRDSGNTLRDETGAPVLVMEGRKVAQCWPEAVRGCFSEELLRRPEVALARLCEAEHGTGLRLLPFRSVGVAQGMLLVCTAENVVIGSCHAARVTLALSPTPVSEMGEYDGLWGGSVL